MSYYELFFNLTRLEIDLWNNLDGRLRNEFGISLGQFEALLTMKRLGPSRIQELSANLGITVGGASKLIDRLEEANFCKRMPNPSDRRSSLVSLTAKAAPIIKTAEPVIEESLSEVFDSALSDSERKNLADSIDRLRTTVANKDLSDGTEN